MSLCISCQNSTNKYKCPKCSAPYCSLDCYKKHKGSEEHCKNLASKDVHTTETLTSAPDVEPTLHEPFGTEDTVPREKLEQLLNSTHLRNLLHNPHLRNLLSEIDVAPNAWPAMRAAMQEPLFVEFADACLKVVEPISAEEQEELKL